MARDDLDYDQCPKCRNYGVETTECNLPELTFHCPDCGHDWSLPYRDDDDDDDDPLAAYISALDD